MLFEMYVFLDTNCCCEIRWDINGLSKELLYVLYRPTHGDRGILQVWKSVSLPSEQEE